MIATAPSPFTPGAPPAPVQTPGPAVPPLSLPPLNPPISQPEDEDMDPVGEPYHRQ